MEVLFEFVLQTNIRSMPLGSSGKIYLHSEKDLTAKIVCISCRMIFQSSADYLDKVTDDKYKQNDEKNRNFLFMCMILLLSC